MDKQELIDRFDEINEDGCMLKKAFVMLADVSLTSAQKLLEAYEGEKSFNNYVCEEEAIEVAKTFKNVDGTMGPKWNADTIFSKVDEESEEPHYNKWALWLTINMEHSDHYNVLKKWSDGDSDKYFEACYDLAVSQLKDEDRPNWIRDYFHLD